MNRRGVGYIIESFVAAVTVFVFVAGGAQTPAAQDWQAFQHEVESQDLTYVLEDTGHVESFLKRSETGSIRTAASSLSGRPVSGSVENLPIQPSTIGFHVRKANIHRPGTTPVTGCSGDLEEIDSEHPVREVSDAPANYSVKLYLADSDPGTTGGFNGEMDYDTVWVDNGTECQFPATQGPFFQDQFIYWGNSTDSNPADHFEIARVTGDGSSIILYNVSQVVRFRKTLGEPVNGIDTPTSVDSFNLSADSLEVYDVLVFRQRSTLDEIDRDRQRIMDYMETGSVLLLMNLTRSGEHSIAGSEFLSRSGLEWVGLPWSSRPSGVAFSSSGESQRVNTLFRAQGGRKPAVKMVPGGNVSSSNSPTMNDGPKLVFSQSGRYLTDRWNASSHSMEEENDVPEGAPESSCGNHRSATFSFPSGDYYVLNTELGDCNGVWGLSIDRNGDGDLEDSGEGPFLEGDRLELGARIYSSRPMESTVDAAEFVYEGSRRIETVNYRTEFESRNIKRFARAPFRPGYSRQERMLVSSVIYWLMGDETGFGEASSQGLSTSAVGSVNGKTFMPYELQLGWGS